MDCKRPRHGKQHAAGDGRTLLDIALGYYRLGLAIIPHNGQKPLVRWKPFQKRRPDEHDLRLWFQDRDDLGIAVVLGHVSGNLVCRDYDTMEAYNQWAQAHPDLARTLPTVRTPRPGRHVYCTVPDEWCMFVDHINGEYRGTSKQVAILPPTYRPAGNGKAAGTYTWLVPFGDFFPLIPDPRGAGLLPEDILSVGQSNREPEIQRQSLCLSVRMDSDASSVEGGQEERNRLTTPLPSVESLEALLESELPVAVGNRNNPALFGLARALKAIPELAAVPNVDLLAPYVFRWHAMGRDRGVIGTEDAEVTWAEFVATWPPRYAKGESPITNMLNELSDEPLPKAAERYTSAKLKRLMAICARLQREAGDNPFFLACRTAGKLLDVGHDVAASLLNLLVHNGDLVIVAVGTNVKATRYRYQRG